jgi:hypothetical protein
MTRPKSTYLSLALTIAAVLCCGLHFHLVVVARAAAPGQGRHLGQEKKAQGHAGEQGEQNEGRGKGHDHAYRLEAHERDTIFGYYANPSRGLPPGLAKRGGNLPPGLEKQLARNGTLPPGLEKRLKPLPVELERELPPLPAGCGCRRGVVGTNVVLIRTRDHFLLDVVRISGR